MPNKEKKFSRRMVAMFWMIIVAIIIGVLIAYEQVAILYVLATLSLVALLLIVGFADLEGVSRMDGESLEGK